MVGPAGTGKGVVIDAAARAEQLTGRDTIGIAVAGSTAQRLGQDSPALAGQTLTLDGLVASVQHGQMKVDPDTTIYLDEAGMVDTIAWSGSPRSSSRPVRSSLPSGTGAAPSIGAGGMFDRLPAIAPSVSCPTSRRTLDPMSSARGQPAGRRGDRAMAHYPPMDSCSCPTPEIRPSSTPSKTGQADHRISDQARSH